MIRELIIKAGGYQRVADALPVSRQAVHKWAVRDALPRTELTGETAYAETLAGLSGVDVADILAHTRRAFGVENSA